MKDYEELLMRIRVYGAKNKDEAKWAERIGIRAYNKFARITNRHILHIYNWIWKKLYPNTKDFETKLPYYDKIYVIIANIIMKPIIFISGGYRFDKYISVNPLYDMYPTDRKNVYETDNMIAIVRRSKGE